MTKTTDLATFSTAAACEKGFDLELRHPVTREGLGVFITVAGQDSTAFRDHARRKANEALRRQFEAKRRGKDADAPTMEQIEADAIELLVAVTLGWRTEAGGKSEPVIVWAGDRLECTPDNARRLYRERFIREQVDEAVGDLANFLPG